MKDVRLITPEDISKHPQEDVIAELKRRIDERFVAPPKSKHKYEKFERNLKLFHGIDDLYPYEVTLPAPPSIDRFENYGLKPDEQVYKRAKMPDGLVKLDKEVKFGGIKRQDAISSIEGNEEFKSFVENIWYKRLTGDWQLINGKPTYISQSYYHYLNFWHMDIGLPHFRSDVYHHCGDLELYYVWDLLIVPSPYCYGLNHFTQRRTGKTHIGGNILYESVSRNYEWHGGLQSKTDNDAEKAFTKSIVKAWRREPFFFQPIFSNSTFPKKEGLQFTPRGKKGKNDAIESIDESELMSSITYASSDAMAYDGSKLHRYWMDECGKCFGKGTKIRMYDGSIKNVEDIAHGELVMGDDSTPRSVYGVTSGTEEMFIVTPNKGESWSCNKSHILSLIWCLNKDRFGFKKKSVVNISVEDYLKLPKWQQKHLMLYKKQVEYSAKEHSLDPYFLGLWLGDGTKYNTQITTIDHEIVSYLNQVAESEGLNLTNKNDVGYTLACNRSRKISGCVDGVDYNFSSMSEASRHFGFSGNFIETGVYKTNTWVETNNKSNRILTALQDYNLISNKHIPNEFLIDSRSNRLKLLAGLLDSDGYLSVVDGKPKVFEITQKIKELAYQIQELATSLGFYCSLNSKNAKMKRHDGSIYECEVFRVSIYGDLYEIPTKIKRKQASKVDFHVNRRNPANCGFKIESIGEGEYFGFAVDKNYLFLLSDGTVVHNTLEVDVYERWNIVKPCLWENDGTGNKIKGKAFLATTVEELEKKGGKYFKALYFDSDRTPDKAKQEDIVVDEHGETRSGLWSTFTPSYCNEVFNKFGVAIVETPTEEESKWLKAHHDKDYLIGGKQRVDNEIAKQGNNEIKKQEIVRKKPRNIREAFASANKAAHFNAKIISDRLQYFTMGYTVNELQYLKFGQYVWKDGVFGGEVEFVETSYEEARVHKVFLPNEDSFKNKRIPSPNGKPKPANTDRFCGSSDTFKYNTRDVKNIKDASKGAMHVFAYYNDLIDGGHPESEWLTDDFVEEYFYRPELVEDYCEDVLKSAIYWGLKVYPENNLDNVAQYFKKHGFENYLQLGRKLTLNTEAGIVYKDETRSGATTNVGIIESMFRVVAQYVIRSGRHCKFYRTLEDFRDVDIDNLNPYDLFVSASYCLMNGFDLNNPANAKKKLDNDLTPAFDAHALKELFYFHSSF